jgi:hypothetical protein
LPAFLCNQRHAHKKESRERKKKKEITISENANPTILHRISRGQWPGAIETQFFVFSCRRWLERKFLGSLKEKKKHFSLVVAIKLRGLNTKLMIVYDWGGTTPCCAICRRSRERDRTR